jgi:hypothetical protein
MHPVCRRHDPILSIPPTRRPNLPLQYLKRLQLLEMQMEGRTLFSSVPIIHQSHIPPSSLSRVFPLLKSQKPEMKHTKG